MMKRFFLLCAVMMAFTVAFAGNGPGNGKGAQAADSDSPQQEQRAAAQAQQHDVPQQQAHSVTAMPEKLQNRIEKMGQKMEKRQAKQGTKDVSGTHAIPEQVRLWLIVGLILILAGVIVFFIMPWLGSLLSSAGVICLVIALIIFLMNYA